MPRVPSAALPGPGLHPCGVRPRCACSAHARGCQAVAVASASVLLWLGQGGRGHQVPRAQATQCKDRGGKAGPAPPWRDLWPVSPCLAAGTASAPDPTASSTSHERLMAGFEFSERSRKKQSQDREFREDSPKSRKSESLLPRQSGRPRTHSIPRRGRLRAMLSVADSFAGGMTSQVACAMSPPAPAQQRPYARTHSQARMSSSLARPASSASVCWKRCDVSAHECGSPACRIPKRLLSMVIPAARHA